MLKTRIQNKTGAINILFVNKYLLLLLLLLLLLYKLLQYDLLETMLAHFMCVF